MVAWLDGQVGSGAGGWMILLLPLSAVAVFLFNIQVTDGWLRRLGGRSRLEIALIDLGRFLASTVAVVAVAWGVSAVLAAAGLDPRGGYVDTYVQRNALVVGVVMGFAIIPIIYTISEDALSAVPSHLRAASLGAGATPWQTAVRVIVPPAVSGLFSAMMIGLGRAVGETMIVLMAAGNTPVMQWNIFNGFRTLSANIAVELPEAVQNSTHYRTLFLAALTLFAMTFVLNTVAEAVRIRFRKKSLEL
jgi:phosphate transport system permease protein